MSATAGTAPPTGPVWHREITDLLSIQQAEIFVLYGDTAGYPQYPGEGVTDYLRRQALAPIIRRSAAALAAEGKEWAKLTTKQQDGILAEQQITCWLAPAAGLTFFNAAEKAAFDKIVPPPEDTPFAQPGPAALPVEFARLAAYVQADNAPPICLVIQHADLIFSPDVPLAPQETLLLSYLRLWASRPLLTGAGSPHRIFLIAGPSQATVKPDLFSGRITAIKIPLPTEPQRTSFVSLLLDTAAEDGRPLAFEDGLDAPLLGRITGALNLLQVEDVIYRAELEGGTISRATVQERKDLLVRDAYGGVLTIEYPTRGWESIVGYDALKKHFTGYVYPRLAAADPATPKGCVLTGPPGTGKSAFAACLAAALRLPLVILQTDKIKDKFVGSSNKNMARVIEGIRALAPCIVLVDEIDKILPTSDDNTGVSQEILGQLQTALSDSPRGLAYWVATTNFPGRIPPALLRPGRFEQVLPLLPAHLDGRRQEVLPVLAERMGLQLDPAADLNRAASLAADYTGADLEKLLSSADEERHEAGRDRITTADLEAAAGYIVPTIRKTGAMQDEALEYCSNRKYLPPSLADRAGTAAPKETTPARARKVRKITDEDEG